MSQDLIADISAGSGSMMLRVDDVTTTALELSDELNSDLVEGADAFVATVAERRDALAERVSAHTALDLIARAGGPVAAEPHVVTDVVAMRSLLVRIDTASRLVEASRDDARARAGVATGLAVHPAAIRDAAADVLDARADLMAAQSDVDRHAEPVGGAADDAADVTDPASDGTGEEEEGAGDATSAAPADPPAEWRLTDRDEIHRASMVAVAAVVIGTLAWVVTGSPFALAIPGVAVCWAVVLVVRQRDDAYDEEIASRNLANVSRLADRAYGGVGLPPDEAPEVDETPRPELLDSTRALADASDRLAFAEASWRALVGPSADVDDVESVVRLRDAQYGVSDTVVAEIPSVRAAAAFRRRLEAQWKLAWWALDRPVPDRADADDALDALDAEGITEVVVSAYVADGLTADEQEQLDDLAGGRDESALREIADQVFAPVVVADVDGSISEEQFRAETAELPDDVRFVLLAPTG